MPRTILMKLTNLRNQTIKFSELSRNKSTSQRWKSLGEFRPKSKSAVERKKLLRLELEQKLKSWLARQKKRGLEL